MSPMENAVLQEEIPKPEVQIICRMELHLPNTGINDTEIWTFYVIHAYHTDFYISDFDKKKTNILFLKNIFVINLINTPTEKSDFYN